MDKEIRMYKIKTPIITNMYYSLYLESQELKISDAEINNKILRAAGIKNGFFAVQVWNVSANENFFTLTAGYLNTTINFQKVPDMFQFENDTNAENNLKSQSLIETHDILIAQKTRESAPSPE